MGGKATDKRGVTACRRRVQFESFPPSLIIGPDDQNPSENATNAILALAQELNPSCRKHAANSNRVEVTAFLFAWARLASSQPRASALQISIYGSLTNR